MIRKERKLYRDGRKNPNGYKKNPYNLFKKKWIPVTFSILIPIAIFISVLELFNVTSWYKIFSSVGIVNGTPDNESNFVVYCLDVGQSDCTIVVCNDEVMMVDTGVLNQVYNIQTSLYTLGINKIDYMVITHQHDDHMAGAAELMKYYDVSNILMPKLSDKNSVESPTYSNLIRTISEYNVNPIGISAGYSFQLGSATIDILSPSEQDKDLNNMSAVIKITYGDTKLLFQGDSDQSIEKQLLMSDYDISADVIKIGHHGSNTSSYGTFLDAVNPEYAIISSGPDNNYGHPNSYVIERLEERNIKPYITSLNGDITIVSNGKNISVSSIK